MKSDYQLALLPEISITSRALTLPDNCTLELWESCGSKIGICVDAGPFIIGDWINEGVKRHGISLSSFLKSDAAKLMPGISSFSYDSLNSFSAVMEKIPKQYRVQGVSFAHHQAASKLIKTGKKEELEESNKWLRISRERSLSLREMAFAINGRAQLADIAKKVPNSDGQSKLPLRASITDISLSIHRSIKSLLEQFHNVDDVIESWSDERKQAAKIALEPIMDDLTYLTDIYITMCK